MPLETYNLGFPLYHADYAHSALNLHQAAERGGAAAASERSQAEAKAQQDTVQQTSETIESNPIPDQSGGGGASYGRNSPEEETEEPPKEKIPQDPLGRGQNLDLSA